MKYILIHIVPVRRVIIIINYKAAHAHLYLLISMYFNLDGVMVCRLV